MVDSFKTNVCVTVFKLKIDDLAARWKTSRGRMFVPCGGLYGAVAGYQYYTFGGDANPNSVNGVFNETEVFTSREKGGCH